MRPLLLVGLVIACALPGCAGEKAETGTTTLTAAEAQALLPPPEAPVYLNPAAPIDHAAPIELWRQRYPQSARLLDEWATRYPRGSSRIVDWSRREPEMLEVLVLWSVTDPNDGIGAFLLRRQNWTELSTIARDEPEAVAAFLHWARRGRIAAEELAVHPGGLSFVEIGYR